MGTMQPRKPSHAVMLVGAVPRLPRLITGVGIAWRRTGVTSFNIRIRSRIRSVVIAAVLTRISSRVGPGVHPGVPPGIHARVCPRIHPWVDPRIRPGVHPRVRPRVHPRVHPRVNPRVGPRVHPGIRPWVQPGVDAGVHPRVHPRVHAWVHPRVGARVHPRVHAGVASRRVGVRISGVIGVRRRGRHRRSPWVTVRVAWRWPRHPRIPGVRIWVRRGRRRRCWARRRGDELGRDLPLGAVCGCVVKIWLAVLRKILRPPTSTSWSRWSRRRRMRWRRRVVNWPRLPIRRARRMPIWERGAVRRRGLRVGRRGMAWRRSVAVMGRWPVVWHRGSSRTTGRHMRDLLVAAATFAFVRKLDFQGPRGARQSLSSIQLPDCNVRILHAIHPDKRRAPALPGVVLHDHHLPHHPEGLEDSPQHMLRHHRPPGQASHEQLGLAPGGCAVVVSPTGYPQPVRLALSKDHRHRAKLVQQRHAAVHLPDSRHRLIHAAKLYEPTSLALPRGPVAEAVDLDDASDVLEKATELILGEISW
mmetsp:Transcript_89045/g.238430  ORF Transcript_89045/g.238430 Transcript_89045/m.238430 type:complete len:530 (+) Transcript_89045:40-1629(+)